MPGGRGFLLVEVCISLLLLTFFSLLIFSWHCQLIKRQEKIYHTMQALCMARSALEQVLQGKPISQPKKYHLTVARKQLLLNYTQFTVTVEHNKQQLSLTSGALHE